MAARPTSDVSGPELAAALKLGFFTQYPSPQVLEEVLGTLRLHICPDAFNRLKQAAGVLTRSVTGRSELSVWIKSLVTAADSAFAPTHPCHTLYDLGRAMGAYCLQQRNGIDSPDAGRIWDCVRRLPDHLTQYAGCLHGLAEEAKGDQDFKAVMKRVLKPWADVIETDDKVKSKAGFERFVARLLPKTQKMMRANYRPIVVEVVSELSRELAEVSDASKRSPVELDQRKINTPTMTASNLAWKQGYLGLQFDNGRRVVRREGIDEELELSPLHWQILQVFDSFEDR